MNNWEATEKETNWTKYIIIEWWFQFYVHIWKQGGGGGYYKIITNSSIHDSGRISIFNGCWFSATTPSLLKVLQEFFKNSWKFIRNSYDFFKNSQDFLILKNFREYRQLPLNVWIVNLAHVAWVLLVQRLTGESRSRSPLPAAWLQRGEIPTEHSGNIESQRGTPQPGQGVRRLAPPLPTHHLLQVCHTSHYRYVRCHASPLESSTFSAL